MSYNYQKKDIARSSLHVQEVHDISRVVPNYKQCFPKVFLLFEDSQKRQQKHLKGQGIIFSKQVQQKGNIKSHLYLWCCICACAHGMKVQYAYKQN
jgi:hypothetical protein